MKFQVGDKVKVKDYGLYSTEVQGIPKTMLRHGSFPARDKEAIVEIVDIHDKFYIIAYVSEKNENMRLGYTEDNLLPTVEVITLEN